MPGHYGKIQEKTYRFKFKKCHKQIAIGIVRILYEAVITIARLIPFDLQIEERTTRYMNKRTIRAADDFVL